MINNYFTKFLKNKTAIITGASGDLGTAMAGALSEVGANIIISARDKDKLYITAENLKGVAENLLVVPCDVSQKVEVENLMKQAINTFGSIDVLVTAAGIQVRKPAIEFSDSEWLKVINVNLTGTFYCCQCAAKYMINQKKGKIITISSLTAEIGIPNIAAYAASRGGIRQLTKTLAVEWARFGINVNCIGPGRIRTKMTEDIFANEKTKKSFLSLIPLGRAGIPDDLTGATLFLASDLSDYITGQSIYVDGGWLASGGNTLS